MKKLLLAVAVAMAAMVPATADEKDLTPAVMAEVAMVEQLVALGKSRGEPLMILAAIRLRATLGGEAGTTGDDFTSQEDAIAAAKKLAQGDEALMGIIESAKDDCVFADA